MERELPKMSHRGWWGVNLSPHCPGQKRWSKKVKPCQVKAKKIKIESFKPAASIWIWVKKKQIYALGFSWCGGSFGWAWPGVPWNSWISRPAVQFFFQEHFSPIGRGGSRWTRELFVWKCPPMLMVSEVTFFQSKSEPLKWRWWKFQSIEIHPPQRSNCRGEQKNRVAVLRGGWWMVSSFYIGALF